MNTKFTKLAKDLNIEITNQMLEKFNLLYEILISENEKFNLTNITKREDVFLLHFLDSLAAVPLIKENANVCDVGSGGGFPALPIKIVRNDISISMIDSVRKKVNYLNETVSKLHLDNAIALHTRVEDYAKTNKREFFDIVTSRAVAKLPSLCEYCLPLVKVGGKFIAYKSSIEEELKESKNAILILGGKIERVIDISIDGYKIKRNLIIISKVKDTPIKYPRNKNKPRISPLL